MNTDKYINDILYRNESVLYGHFKLSSGLHSDTYVQCAKTLCNPIDAATLGRALFNELDELYEYRPDLVIAPAMGGIIIGHEVARNLNNSFFFTERVDGKVQLRRGFKIEPGQTVVVIEDVITTGKSTNEVIDLVHELGGQVVAVGCIIDRSEGSVGFGVPIASLTSVQAFTYTPEDCPKCKQGIDFDKPGSRS